LLLQMNSDRSASSAASSMPWATSWKNGLVPSSITYASVRLVPARSWRADSLRTNPRSAIARSTRSRVRALTTSGRFITFETVPSETPAAAATSFTDGVLPFSTLDLPLKR
jgi:hypothetical protein